MHLQVQCFIRPHPYALPLPSSQWLRDGRRVAVSIPHGCLLVQAGKQLEWLTGGAVRAGMHEVVVADSTLQAVARAVAEQRPLWRVSSTVFTHVASAKVRVVLCGFEQWIRPAPPPLPPSAACPPPSPPLPHPLCCRC